VRVSHLEFRRRLEDVKSKITDKEFFTSSLFRGYMADMAEATSKRYKKPIQVKIDWDESEGSKAANTDNRTIYINAANRITSRLGTRVLKFQSLIGLLAHEIGHVLFSDFEGLVLYKESIFKYEFYPSIPKDLNELEEEALKDIASRVPSESARKLITKTAASILNTVEDVYVDARICYEFPGTYKAGIFLFVEHMKRDMPPLKKQIEKGLRPLAIIHNILLEYALFGDISNSEGLENEYTEALYRCIPYIDDAVYSDNVFVRYEASNKILLNIWSFLEDAISDMEEAENEEAGGGDATLEELLEQLAEIAEQMGDTPSGKNKPISDGKEEAPEKEELEASAPERKKIKITVRTVEKEDDASEEGGDGEGEVKTEAEAGGDSKTPEETDDLPTLPEKPEKLPPKSDDAPSPDDEGEGEKDDEKTDDASDPAHTTAASESADEEDDDEAHSSPSIPTADSGSSSEQASKPEAMRIPPEKTDDIDTEGEGGIERNSDYESANHDLAATEIIKLLETMATEKVEAALDEEMCEGLQALANEIRYGDAHKGKKIIINRMATVSGGIVESYNTVSAPLLALSKRLQKQVAPILKDRREGGKMTGLLYGKRFNSRDIVRKDGRYFCNTRLPSEPMEMVVAVLVDESGSMGCDRRDTTARAASIVLYDFCRGLDIPVAIYGHTESYHGKADVHMYAHAEFDTYDRNDKYRLMDIRARSNNRDGAALRFTAERLLKRHEPLKLLIVISDGQPLASGYSGTAAEADLRGIKQEYTRKGIKLFAAAIGDDKPDIERIYGDGFLDITNLEKLPQNLCALLSRYIKTM